MDLDKPMTLEEWQQVRSIPGLRKVAIDFELKWAEYEKLKRSSIVQPNGSRHIFHNGMITAIPPEGEIPFKMI